MNSASILEALLPALKRLDHLIGQAVAAMQADGVLLATPSVTSARTTVSRWLVREPAHRCSIPQPSYQRIRFSLTSRVIHRVSLASANLWPVEF